MSPRRSTPPRYGPLKAGRRGSGCRLRCSTMGYGHTSLQVAEVGASRAADGLLAEYHEAVHAQTVKLVSGVTDADLPRIVDERWTPPVTLAVRLVSVLDDDMQHAGQAAYVKGLLLQAGLSNRP